MFLLPVLLHFVCQEKLKEVDRWHVVLWLLYFTDKQFPVRVNV